MTASAPTVESLGNPAVAVELAALVRSTPSQVLGRPMFSPFFLTAPMRDAIYEGRYLGGVPFCKRVDAEHVAGLHPVVSK